MFNCARFPILLAAFVIHVMDNSPDRENISIVHSPMALVPSRGSHAAENDDADAEESGGCAATMQDDGRVSKGLRHGDSGNTWLQRQQAHVRKQVREHRRTLRTLMSVCFGPKYQRGSAAIR